MAIKYIPGTKRDVWKYRTSRAAKERQRKDISEASYIALRKIYFQKKKEIPNFETLSQKVNSFTRQQKHKQLMEVFNYYIADIN